ncbi:MAG: glycosyltransferase family 2 protein [Verrucomicrobia bacterium]|nr:glycosyltransferase family 2 protein [Verrucomicrobiota bacterium]
MQRFPNPFNPNLLITTIIPTFRRPHMLRRAIQSVLSQTFPHFQVCVYDNASGDETAAFVSELAQQDPRVKYHCHPENIGAVANFQYGLSHVETPYFSFLSDDDYLLPKFFETLMEKLQQHPEAFFAVGAVMHVNEKGDVLHVHQPSDPKRSLWTPPEGLYEMVSSNINWAGILFRKEVIEKIGKLDPTLKIIDADYVLRAASQCPFAASNVPCAVFTQHSASYSSSAGLKLIWPGWLQVMEKLVRGQHIPASNQAEIRACMLKKFQSFLFPLALKCLRNKEILQAVKVAEILESECQAFKKSWIIKRLAKSTERTKFLFLIFIGMVELRRKFFKPFKSKLLKART